MQNLTTPTEYRQQLRQHILEAATHAFHTKGIKAVRMDDIANMLSVSKRTIYEIYDNKEQLLMETVIHEHESFEQHMLSYAMTGNHHVIDIVLEFYRTQMKTLSDMTPNYYVELHKYPKVVDWLEQKHKEKEEKSMMFFRQGISEGYFRTDANYELISAIGNASLNYIMEHQLYKQYNLKRIFKDVVMLFVRGFCTLKGIKELDRQIEAYDAEL